MLSTPPAFILSQDQTLIKKFFLPESFWLTVLRSHLRCCPAKILSVSADFSTFQKAETLRIFQGCFTVQLSRFFFLSSQATTSIYYHSHSLLSTTFFKKITILFLENKERRKRDSNPRAGYPTYTLSRGTSSAS